MNRDVLIRATEARTSSRKDHGSLIRALTRGALARHDFLSPTRPRFVLVASTCGPDGLAECPGESSSPGVDRVGQRQVEKSDYLDPVALGPGAFDPGALHLPD